MMNTQHSTILGKASAEAVRALPAGQVVALGSGELSILSGRVWLTRSGDPDDHVLDAGQSVRLGDAGRTVVEAWERGSPALIAWQPSGLVQRLRERFGRTCTHCFELMSPAGRVGIGSAAAIAALLVAGVLFGTLSDARVRALVGPAKTAVTVLHNAAPGAVGAFATRGSLADGSDTRDRAPGAAQQAGRRAAGAA